MIRRYKPRRVIDLTWTPDLAYAVGLIATDGCLSSNRKNIVFTSQDIEQITNMKIILMLPGKIGYTRNSKSEAYRIQFTSAQLYDWLCSLGLTSNKSLTLGELKIPDKYFIDFLRGHLDGDGSISTYTDRYNTFKNDKYVYERLWVRFISGSQDHIRWLHLMIRKLLGVTGRVHITKPNYLGRSMYIIKFGKKESLGLLEKIYYSDTLPCLTRKKTIYLSFLAKI
jgi:hypothetical protein